MVENQMKTEFFVYEVKLQLQRKKLVAKQNMNCG